MTVLEATQLGREALLVALVVGGPALFVTLVVGTAVSLLQAVTSVSEPTLTFLPKLLAISLVLGLSAGWMAMEMKSFGEECFGRIATVSQ